MWASERRSLGLRLALVASVALVAAACSGSSASMAPIVGAPIGNLSAEDIKPTEIQLLQ